MSSTKRGGKRSKADNYPTPHWCVKRLLEAVKLPNGRWLEPGCGAGDIVRAVQKVGVLADFTGFDIRETKFIKSQPPGMDLFVGNLLKPEGRLLELMNGPRFDVSIGNPPFRLAAEFIDFALKVSHYVVYLLRLNYLGSDKRAELMHATCPDVFVLPNRPSFIPSKRGLLTTDSIEYAWFLWGPEMVTVNGVTVDTRYRSVGKLQVLKTTPKEERRA